MKTKTFAYGTSREEIKAWDPYKTEKKILKIGLKVALIALVVATPGTAPAFKLVKLISL